MNRAALLALLLAAVASAQPAPLLTVPGHAPISPRGLEILQIAADCAPAFCLAALGEFEWRDPEAWMQCAVKGLGPVDTIECLRVGEVSRRAVVAMLTKKRGPVALAVTTTTSAPPQYFYQGPFNPLVTLEANDAPPGTDQLTVTWDGLDTVAVPWAPPITLGIPPTSNASGRQWAMYVNYETGTTALGTMVCVLWIYGDAGPFGCSKLLAPFGPPPPPPLLCPDGKTVPPCPTSAIYDVPQAGALPLDLKALHYVSGDRWCVFPGAWEVTRLPSCGFGATGTGVLP